MDKLNEIKLEIYERCNKGEISQDECNILLEKAEQKYEYGDLNVDLTEEEQIAVECVREGLMTIEEATEICEEYTDVTEKGGVEKTVDEVKDATKRHAMTVKIIGDAKKEYKENEAKIKDLIKDKKYFEAKVAIKKCEDSLQTMKKSIESMKDEPSDAVISFVTGTACTFLVNRTIDTITETITAHLVKKPSLTKEIIRSAEEQALYTAFKKHKSGTWNTTRANALKVINKQFVKIKKLEKMISKAESVNN